MSRDRASCARATNRCFQNAILSTGAVWLATTCFPVLAMEPTVGDSCPQVDNERISNLTEQEFRDTFRDDVRGQRVLVTPLGSGINLFRVERASPGQFVTRRSLRALDDRRRRVLYSEPNYRVTVRSAAPGGGADASSQYGLNKIKARDVWDKGFQGSPDITVAVVDTGIHADHPDLKDNLWKAGEAFTVTLPPPLAPIVCPKGSIGFNSLDMSCATETLTDGSGHGTHVAGIIGASGDTYIYGVAPKTTLLVVKAFDDAGSGHIKGIVRGLNFILQVAGNDQLRTRIRVVNNSWGYPGLSARSDCFSQGLSDMVDVLVARGMLFVAAADNYERDQDAPNAAPFYMPSFSSDGVLSVSASGEYDSVAGAYGKCSVDIRAPGIDISSTKPPPAWFESKTGTSMATAFVSGGAALVLSACPTLTWQQLKSVLMNSVDLTNQYGRPVRSSGRLNVARAIATCMAPGFTPAPLEPCP